MTFAHYSLLTFFVVLGIKRLLTAIMHLYHSPCAIATPPGHLLSNAAVLREILLNSDPLLKAWLKQELF